MAQQCPDCKHELAEFAVSCEYCGWSLTEAIRQNVDLADKDAIKTGYDLHYEAANAAIERGDHATALRSIARAMLDATPQQRCEAIALRGYVALKQGDFKTADSDCSEAIKSGWNDARTFAWRAAARSGLKVFHLAFDDLAHAISISHGESAEFDPLIPSFLEQARLFYQNRLTDQPHEPTWFWQRGWVYMRAMVFEKAERDFTAALKLDSNCGWAWVGLANVKLETGNGDMAVKIASKVTAHPDRDVAWAALSCRAKAWSLVDGPEACQDDLERLSELAGGDSELILQLAQLRYDLRLWAATVSDCDTLIRINGDNIQSRLLRGSALARLGNSALAVKDLSRFINAFPDHCLALTERGNAFIGINEPDRALKDFTSALKGHSRFVPAYLGRARAYLLRKKTDLASVAIEKALGIDDRQHEAYEIRGQIRFQENDYQSAIDDFSRAIEIAKFPEQKAGGFYLRGTTHYEIGQLDLARSDFETASQLRPGHAGNWIWLAAVDARREQWSSAIHSLQRAINCRPSNAKQYLTLGRPVATSAVENLTRQIQRENDDINLVRDRGLAYQFLGKTGEALADFNKVLETVEDDLETRVRRGQLFQKSGKHIEAVKDFTYVIRRDKIHHTVRYYRALSLFALGQESPAMSDVLKALKLSPRESRYHVLRGEMVQREGRVKRAIRCYDRAIAFDPGDPAPRRLKGLALMDLNAAEAALSELNRAVEMAPENADGYVARGQFYLRAKQFDQAKLEFDRGIACNPQHLRSYLGKSAVLINQGLYHETVLWLTKSLHRFTEKRHLAEVLMKRGRAFYQMGLSAFAVNDFSSALVLFKKLDETSAARARYDRALAYLQAGQSESARQDLVKIGRRYPLAFPTIPAIIEWMNRRDGPPPSEIYQPDRMAKIPKPKIVRSAIKLNGDAGAWSVAPPYDTWIVRVDEAEYGPVSKATLDRWLEQGRLTTGMKVMRGDWSRWKHIEKVYRELLEKPG
ncbi:MAG: tetratricopeptide repeat protein [Pirellulaceae bacterium]|nr:tetratricopeptide repeat protein [Pirellulaceae bacterium]